MGRPIKRKFFGVDNVNDGLTYSDAGGEGVASIAVAVPGANYSQGTTISFSASPIGGTKPTAHLSFLANLGLSSVTIDSAGTGYLAAPTATLTAPANVSVAVTGWTGNAAGNVLTVSSTTGLYVGMHTTGVNLNQNAHINSIDSATQVTMSSGNIGTVSGTAVFYDRGFLQGVGTLGTVTLASTITTANTIQANAWTTTGTVGKVADIVSQRSSRRYKVTNSVETDVCQLVANAAVVVAGGPLAAGQMTITATDSAGGTYYVKSLDSRVVVMYPGTGTQFNEDVKVAWTSTDVAVVNGGTAAAPSVNARVKIATNN